MLLVVLLALAVSVKQPGAVETAFVAGLVRLTDGGTSEVTVTTAEVVAMPKASVALAVRL